MKHALSLAMVLAVSLMVFFERDDPNFKRNEEQIRADLMEAQKNVRVLLAVYNGEKRRPKPEYLGEWLTNG